MKNLTIALLVLAASMPGMAQSNNPDEASADEALNLTVDARTQCLSTFNGEFSAAILRLANGPYRVSLKSNAFYSGGSLPVKKVAFYITTDDQPSGWFHIVNEGSPIYIRVSGLGTDANRARAFFIDGACGDNTGEATLTFRRVPRIPAMCVGSDC